MFIQSLFNADNYILLFAFLCGCFTAKYA